MTPTKILFLSVIFFTGSAVCFYIAEQVTQANRSLAFAVVTLAFAFAARVAERQSRLELQPEFTRREGDRAAAST